MIQQCQQQNPLQLENSEGHMLNETIAIYAIIGDRLKAIYQTNSDRFIFPDLSNLLHQLTD
ncbi:MAG: hypothetical protein HWQ42_21715 [Nostoc sp. JL23]|uniref:hypothetical protein n=1 Tax=uncultured Nostoc sp. TaxID=340711 RepID=UPI001D8D0DDD|nr:hypothetical protein [Nostoc sp. JL23]